MERCSSSRGTFFCGPKKHCRGYILPLFIPFFIHSSFLFHSFSFLFNLFSSLFISFHHFFIHFSSIFRHFFITFSSFPPLSPLYLPLPPLIPPLSNTLINSRLTIKVVEVVIKSAKKFWGMNDWCTYRWSPEKGDQHLTQGATTGLLTHCPFRTLSADKMAYASRGMKKMETLFIIYIFFYTFAASFS